MVSILTIVTTQVEHKHQAVLFFESGISIKKERVDSELLQVGIHWFRIIHWNLTLFISNFTEFSQIFYYFSIFERERVGRISIILQKSRIFDTAKLKKFPRKKDVILENTSPQFLYELISCSLLN
ncbi:hypothetical protein HHI36_006956 [Cryptolaemus montrouzieri]|uniref:Uncharacterized protein n=1 Tax=Cryptolaemus montrouzieri TaxID=559131 RepID=A0ABD2MN89_9CUCU